MYAPLASREQLLAELERIDVEGWDSESARALLAYVRCHVVRRFIALSRFRGPLAADLEASAWSAAWESLASPYLRTTDSPVNVLWAVVRRTVASELNAAKLLADAREARRLSPLSSAGHAVDETTRVQPPLRFDQGGADALTQAGGLFADPPGVLSHVIGALVEAGWPVSKATEAVEAIASQARTHGYRFTAASGWRRLAAGLELPQWQVRRLTILLVGLPDRPGLVERMVREGVQVLGEPPARAVVRSTLRRKSATPTLWQACPSSAGEERLSLSNTG